MLMSPRNIIIAVQSAFQVMLTEAVIPVFLVFVVFAEVSERRNITVAENRYFDREMPFQKSVFSALIPDVRFKAFKEYLFLLASEFLFRIEN